MSANPLKVKGKKCKSCLKFFTPTRPMQTTCCIDCAIQYSNKPKVQKAYKMEKKKELMEKYPDKAKWLKLAQTVVNKYVRLRDQEKPCISCKHSGDRQFHAGHFIPQGNNQQLRYYTLNIWKQCSICNNYLSGNLVPYRANMIEKLGLEKVEEMEANQERGNYTIEYLERLIKVFRKKIKLYEGRR